jgi:hypothetical protein
VQADPARRAVISPHCTFPRCVDSLNRSRYPGANVTNRLAILLVLALFGAASLAIGSSACGSGPYTGKPERLKKPRAKKRPADAAVAEQRDEGKGDGDGEGEGAEKSGKKESAADGAGAAASDEPCRTNFFAEPKSSPRKSKEARAMAIEADPGLRDAEGQSGPARQELVTAALATLTNALEKDPYAPEPTYKMAVAYALVGRKSCSLALLERLKGLATMPEVEKEAQRAIQRAARDPAFQPFDKEARTALGL